jgi:hypothetical protein
MNILSGEVDYRTEFMWKHKYVADPADGFNFGIYLIELPFLSGMGGGMGGALTLAAPLCYCPLLLFSRQDFCFLNLSTPILHM